MDQNLNSNYKYKKYLLSSRSIQCMPRSTKHRIKKRLTQRMRNNRSCYIDEGSSSDSSESSNEDRQKDIGPAALNELPNVKNVAELNERIQYEENDNPFEHINERNEMIDNEGSLISDESNAGKTNKENIWHLY